MTSPPLARDPGGPRRTKRVGRPADEPTHPDRTETRPFHFVERPAATMILPSVVGDVVLEEVRDALAAEHREAPRLEELARRHRQRSSRPSRSPT